MKTWFDCFDTPLRATGQPTRLRRTQWPLRRAALTIMAAAMAASLIACEGGKAIQIVKSAHIDDYPNKTVGEAFEDFFGSPKWEEGGLEDDNIREQGITLVNFTGKMMYADKEVEAVIQFQANKDTGAFKFEAFELNGIPQDLLRMATQQRQAICLMNMTAMNMAPMKLTTLPIIPRPLPRPRPMRIP